MRLTPDRHMRYTPSDTQRACSFVGGAFGSGLQVSQLISDTQKEAFLFARPLRLTIRPWRVAALSTRFIWGRSPIETSFLLRACRVGAPYVYGWVVHTSNWLFCLQLTLRRSFRQSIF